jgi:cAMP-binding proteins - catabolite gene activator and regulatory subunit of cAMP-dependent protein kinases
MNYKFLNEVSIFEDLADQDLEKLSKIMVTKHFSKGEMLFMEGDEGNSMYIIKSGKVKILNISEDGKEKIFSILSEGEFSW